MTRVFLRSIFALAIAMFASSAMAVTTFYVGTCHAGSFATIMDAVNSPKVAAGSTIKVCPAFYAEQIIINRSLTIEGTTGTVQPNNDNVPNNMAWVTPPQTATTVHSALSGITFQPSIWVQSGTLTLSGIFLSIHANGQTNCPIAYTGLYFAPGASGTINHIYEANDSAGPCGIGVWAENNTTEFTTVKVENSWISTDFYGIVGESQQPNGFAPVLDLAITGNQMTIKNFGIYLFQTRGAVTGNTISMLGGGTRGEYGIDDVAPSTSVSRNTIYINSSTGIVTGEANDTVTANKIFSNVPGQFPVAIDMGCFTGNVTGNVITGTSSIVGMPVGYTGKNTYYASWTLPDSGGC
jgi:hypothetical protein